MAGYSNIIPSRVIVVTNIPSPYRSFLFDTFHDVLSGLGIEFRVHYLGITESDRFWRFDEKVVRYGFRFEKGFHFGSPFFKHVNPYVPLKFLNCGRSVLIVGGYDNLATLALAAVPVSPSTLKVLWSETNLISESRRSGLFALLKRFAIRQYGCFLVPGKWAEEFVLRYHSAASPMPFIHLPNLIDENAFRGRGQGIDSERARDELGIGKDEIVGFISARLEAMKNVLFFLSRLPDAFWRKSRIYVAGTGSQKRDLEALRSERGLDSRLVLLGQVSAERMPRYYRSADIFMLPSLQDPSPLSCVEAITSGLPLALSSHVGNHPEVLIPGENGWIFDPNSASDIDALGMRLAGSSRAELSAMGRKSRAIAEEYFSASRVVRRAVEEILKAYRTNCI